MSEFFESHGILFCPSAISDVRNGTLWSNKPRGGFWASPADSRDSWKRWCVREQFCLEALDVFTRFSLTDNARVCVIDSDESLAEWTNQFPRTANPVLERPALADVVDAIGHLRACQERDLPCNLVALRQECSIDRMPKLDPINYEALLRSDRFDALLVRPSGLSRVQRWNFHSWDCDTLLVANPAVVTRVQYLLYGTQVDLHPHELAHLNDLRMECLLDAFPAGGRDLGPFFERCRALAERKAMQRRTNGYHSAD